MYVLYRCALDAMVRARLCTERRGQNHRRRRGEAKVEEYFAV
jgi:hypothetical protein